MFNTHNSCFRFTIPLKISQYAMDVFLWHLVAISEDSTRESYQLLTQKPYKLDNSHIKYPSWLLCTVSSIFSWLFPMVGSLSRVIDVYLAYLLEKSWNLNPFQQESISVHFPVRGHILTKEFRNFQGSSGKSSPQARFRCHLVCITATEMWLIFPRDVQDPRPQ